MFKAAARPASFLARRGAKVHAVQNATFNTSAPLQKSQSRRVERDQTIRTLSNGIEIPAVAYQTTILGNSAPRDWKSRFNNGWRHVDISASFNPKNYLERQIWDLADVTRDELFIASKLESWMHHDPYISLLHHLRGLRTGYLDLWYLKHPVSWMSSSDKSAPVNKAGETIDYLYAWKQMEKAYESGKVKALGVCNFSKAELEKLLRHAKHAPHVHQMEVTPYLQQRDFVKFNQEHGIAICSLLPFNNVNQGQRIPIAQDLLDEPVLQQLRYKYQLPPAHIVAAWVISNGHIVSVDNKQSDPDNPAPTYLRADVELEPEDIEELNTLECAGRAIYPKGLGYIPLADLEGINPEAVRPLLDGADRELVKLRKKWEEEQAEDPDEIKYGTMGYDGKVMPWVRSLEEKKLSTTKRQRAKKYDQSLPGDPYHVPPEDQDAFPSDARHGSSNDEAGHRSAP
ncbi:hypothetical protein Dda_4463 [Drechslerella dactyloides]|uniref:NADP-dependent oxidoreductase domain-containing protein n=1 Tax=Drechslerella dactyloides TaxID=74499 RepID=A0AAD6IYC0_DREDA|nr:hypothetical protein Dda_4463 [Drechslerella dactyloides]